MSFPISSRVAAADAMRKSLRPFSWTICLSTISAAALLQMLPWHINKILITVRSFLLMRARRWCIVPHLRGMSNLVISKGQFICPKVRRPEKVKQELNPDFFARIACSRISYPVRTDNKNSRSPYAAGIKHRPSLGIQAESVICSSCPVSGQSTQAADAPIQPSSAKDVKKRISSGLLSTRIVLIWFSDIPDLNILSSRWSWKVSCCRKISFGSPIFPPWT